MQHRNEFRFVIDLNQLASKTALHWLAPYIFRKLTNREKERGQDPAKPDTSAIMEPIAHSLTEQQIAAVAAYLSYLE
jgi:cytochrome c553